MGRKGTRVGGIAAGGRVEKGVIRESSFKSESVLKPWAYRGALNGSRRRMLSTVKAGEEGKKGKPRRLRKGQNYNRRLCGKQNQKKKTRERARRGRTMAERKREGG